ncbi:MAG: alpha/beta hydrolase fold domain-containing protein [Planctomycetota bacterium]|jgi:triacylglycerol lipase
MRTTLRLAHVTLPIAVLALVITLGSNSVANEVHIEKDLVYAQPDGVTLHLDAYTPKNQAAPMPAVVLIHGGSWRGGSKRQVKEHATRLAKAGIAAFAIQYRLAPQHKWPAQIHDCKAAVRWVRSQARRRQLDPQRIGAFGYSAGGHLATLLALTGPQHGLDEPGANLNVSAGVQAVVAGGAPCDFTWMPRRIDVLGYWLGGSRRKNPDAYRNASPLTYVSAERAETTPPLLFFHGKWDIVVNPLMGPRKTVSRLRRAGVDATIQWIPGAGHAIAMRHKRSYQLTVDFMKRHLTGNPADTP